MMPSTRRIKVTALALTLLLCIILYTTSDTHSPHDSAFARKTEAALNAKHATPDTPSTSHSSGEDGGQADYIAPDKPIKDRLKDAEVAAKQAADRKLPLKPEQPPMGTEGKWQVTEEEEERSVAGRKKMPPKEGQAPIQPDAADDETEEEHRTAAELNSILKKSPVIIFSKSYCPHSTKAKHILLDRYNIRPTPFVVELDQHPLGPLLQRLLAKRTGRATVPNVLVQGVSLGGGDDIAELDHEGKLEEKIRKAGGTRMTQVQLRGS
ncbi:MAG: hypothetical protein M1824_003123 [Vezdaea acicularis]|nr:MAG: hypothetical protein M1824_003123 [Vezdaea acicularis]